MEIIYTSKFSREYKRLQLKVKLAAEEREEIFRDDPFDPKLNTHKLHGQLKEFWSFAIGYDYRIIFEFNKTKKIVYFHLVGNHDIYQS